MRDRRLDGVLAIVTGGYAGLPQEEQTAAINRVQHLMKNVQQGAATSVRAATSPQLAGLGGVYCENADIAAPVPADSQEVNGVRPWAMDPQAAEKLWALSEGWTGHELR